MEQLDTETTSGNAATNDNQTTLEELMTTGFVSVLTVKQLMTLGLMPYMTIQHLMTAALMP